MKFRTVGLIVTLALGLLAAALLAEAQQAAKVAKIGILTLGAGPGSPLLGAFLQELREGGWVEGQNLIIEHRYAEGRAERLPALADELVGLQVDVIFAAAAPSIRAAKQATTTIPIVFQTLGDAVAMGFVDNLVRPGGNITGVTGFAPELGGKWLDQLRKVVPDNTHVAVLTNPGNPNTPSIVREIERAARALGVQLHIVERRDPITFEHAFATMTSAQVGALIVPPDPLFYRERRQIVGLAATHRLPAIYGIGRFVDIGGLMFYGTSLPDHWRRAAVYVDKILRGANPGDLPIERPTKFDLIVNLKTAKQLGITIPPMVLYQATKVIR